MVKKNTIKKYKNNAFKKSTTLKKHVRNQKGGGVREIIDAIEDYDDEPTGKNFQRFKKILNDNKSYINEDISTGDTPLKLAVLFRKIDLVKLLLDNGADPHKANRYGKTAMYFANKYNFPEIKNLEPRIYITMEFF